MIQPTKICKICGKIYEKKCTTSRKIWDKSFLCSLKCNGIWKSRQISPLKGRKFPERCGNNHPMFGKHHTAEAREKNRLKHLGKPSWNKGINFKQIMGKNNTNWNGGILHSKGYIFILMPNHPNSKKNGYVKRCILIMEKYIGRYLTKEERVHHINEIKNDDQIENLQLFPNESEHQKYHFQLREKDFKGRLLPKS